MGKDFSERIQNPLTIKEKSQNLGSVKIKNLINIISRDDIEWKRQAKDLEEYL